VIGYGNASQTAPDCGPQNGPNLIMAIGTVGMHMQIKSHLQLGSISQLQCFSG
jgi:hypothetical protein